MKLKDITHTVTDKKPGTYAGIRFSPETVEALEAFGKTHKIANQLTNDDFHSTLLYSRKHLPNYEPAGDYQQPMIGTPTQWDVWPSNPDEDGNTRNILVLQYSCPPLYQRHHELMQKHGATYDFDTYKPHITISYDAGDINVDKLPLFDGDIEIVSEYMEELDPS